MIKKTIGSLLAVINGIGLVLVCMTVIAVADLLGRVTSWFDGFRLVAIPVVGLLCCVLIWKIDLWKGRAVTMAGIKWAGCQLLSWMKRLTPRQRVLGLGTWGLIMVGVIAFYAGRLYQYRINIDDRIFWNSMTLRMIDHGQTNKVTSMLQTALVGQLDYHDALSRNPFRLYKLDAPYCGRHWEYEVKWATERVKTERDDFHYCMKHPDIVMERFAAAMNKAAQTGGRSNLSFRGESGKLTLHGLDSGPTIRKDSNTNVEPTAAASPPLGR